MSEKTAVEIVKAARSEEKITSAEILTQLFSDFIELHGDRSGTDDPAIKGGIADFHGQAVTVITTDRGQSIEERMACHFGCPEPGGYRKSLRLIKQAQKFGRPVFCFVNTPGAYPGQSAEENGQGSAIAQNLLEISKLAIPIITVVFGEGGSGGHWRWLVAMRSGCLKTVLIQFFRQKDSPRSCGKTAHARLRQLRSCS